MTPESTSIARLERLLQRTLRSRRRVALLGAALLVACFGLGLAIDDPTEPGAILYAAPVVLVALALGPLPGAGAGAVAAVFFWLANLYHEKGLSALDLGYRALLLVLLGTVTGALANRLTNAEHDAARLLELAHEGVWIVDEQARSTYVNPRMAELLGTTVAEVLRSPTSRWVADDEELLARLERRRSGLAERYETRLCRADGSSLWALVSAAPLADARGRSRGSLALVSDVTDRRRAEEELRASEARLAEAQRIAHIGSWEWQVAADEITWSAELFRIWGVTSAEFQPTYDGYLELMHPADREAANAAVQQAFETHEPFSFRHRVVRPDGSVRTVESAGAVFVEDGRVTRMAGVGHDITERVEAEGAYAAVAAEVALQQTLRARAVELNDAVVQGLALTRYLLAADDREGALAAVQATLARAKNVVSDLIGDLELEAGALRRASSAELVD